MISQINVIPATSMSNLGNRLDKVAEDRQIHSQAHLMRTTISPSAATQMNFNRIFTQTMHPMGALINLITGGK